MQLLIGYKYLTSPLNVGELHTLAKDLWHPCNLEVETLGNAL